MTRREQNREANIWVARGVPVTLLGIIGYGSWVITKVLCIDYLLRPPSSSFSTPQVGPAVAILVVYYVLFIVTLVCYARLLYVVTRHPGLVPRGRQWYQEKHRSRQSRHSQSKRRHRERVEESKNIEPDPLEGHTAEKVTNAVATDADIRVEDFWHREIFTCGYDGRPPFCSTCHNWKPDRAHHCSELDRCVLKMDHFCPWVGGVVGETSFKFFIQFTFWAALLCTHILVSVAYYFAQRRRLEGTINVHWTVILAISGLFLLFSAGMCMSSLQFAFINSTTIENLSRKRKVWYLAVHVPENILEEIENRGRSNLRLITYPRPPSEQFQASERDGENTSQDAPDQTLQPVIVSQPTQPSRTFAILETSPGTNPFNLGLKRNIMDIMGTNPWEWLFPIRPSPCVRHDSSESFYTMGPSVNHLKHEARVVNGIADARTRRKRSHHRRRKSGGHHRSHTPQPNEGSS